MQPNGNGNAYLFHNQLYSNPNLSVVIGNVVLVRCKPGRYGTSLLHSLSNFLTSFYRSVLLYGYNKTKLTRTKQPYTTTNQLLPS